MTADTIYAISTAPGVGGIAVIRISGPQSIPAADVLFRPFNHSHRLCSRPSHTATFGHIINPATNEVLDEVVVNIFRAPHSFTGEDVVEISCHGSLYIQQQLLDILSNLSQTSTLPTQQDSLATSNSQQQNSSFLTPNSSLLTPHSSLRLALSGEFTRRAFTSGRFDLTQAEAVADLISAQSAAAHRLALQQMRGGISHKLSTLHDQLLQLTSLLELELDFSEEDVEFADRTRLLQLANEINVEVLHLANSFQQGQAIKDGIPVAIIGAPNVGKSTLLNALLHEDRAIVSDIQGTTRDVIEDTIHLGGYLFRFIDTAGIRATEDKIERLGIERSRQAASRAHVILLLTEPGVPFVDIVPQPHQHVIRLVNKTPEFQALHHVGITELEQQLISLARPATDQGDIILTNRRHYDALIEAHSSLQQVIQGLSAQLSGDLIAEDLRAVISSLNSILGREITSQDTLNNIFKNFCIGK